MRYKTRLHALEEDLKAEIIRCLNRHTVELGLDTKKIEAMAALLTVHLEPLVKRHIVAALDA